jgi:hypothetical protein
LVDCGVAARDTGNFRRLDRCAGLTILDDARHLLVNKMAIALARR